MAELIGLPYPPAVGETALKPGTYDGVCVFVTGGGTGLGQGDRLRVRPRSARRS